MFLLCAKGMQHEEEGVATHPLGCRTVDLSASQEAGRRLAAAADADFGAADAAAADLLFASRCTPTPATPYSASLVAPLSTAGTDTGFGLEAGGLAAPGQELESVGPGLGSEETLAEQGGGDCTMPAKGEEGVPAVELELPGLQGVDAAAGISGAAGSEEGSRREAAMQQLGSDSAADTTRDLCGDEAGEQAVFLSQPGSGGAADAGAEAGGEVAGKRAALMPITAAAANSAPKTPGAGAAGQPCKQSATPAVPSHPLAAITPSTGGSALLTPLQSQAAQNQAAARRRVLHIDPETFDACFSAEPSPALGMALSPMDALPAAASNRKPYLDNITATSMASAAGEPCRDASTGDGGGSETATPCTWPAQAGASAKRAPRARAAGGGRGLERVAYSSGDEYAGEVARGMAAGLGVYSFAGEGRYEGEVGSADPAVAWLLAV